MEPEIIIFAPADDPHASAVAWALRENGDHPLWIPSIRMGDDVKVAAWSDADQFRFECSLSSNSFREVRSLWHRRPSRPIVEACGEADRSFIEGQWNRFQSNIFSISDVLFDALWINSPDKAVRAENKLLQMHIAKQVGLEVPEIVFSNDVNDVRCMLHKWPKVIFKTFYPYSWFDSSSRNLYTMTVKILDGDSELPDAAISLCPGIYQRYIDKAYDLRVTVIGERYFSVRILRDDGTAYVDWRDHAYDKDVIIEICSLNESTENKLRSLMKKLNLVFGCIDLIVDKSGKLYFLEVNQAGQFLFIEDVVPELPLLKAMVNMMASGRVDYSLECRKKCDFASYKCTEDYEKIVDMQNERKNAISSPYISIETGLAS